jgi:O-antigen/teichoic acid export membrane protein
MKIRSVKKNYILNVFRVVSSAIIGIITMPYINRVLGADSIGKVEYVNTIINYFLLFSGLGIPMYGIREIAKVRDNIEQRSKTVLELLIILAFTTIISYLFLFGILFQINYLNNYRELIILMSSMILLTNIGADWYFQGMENQLFITVRYIIVRIIALFLLFYLVKNSNDYLYYALIIVLTVCGSNVFNIFYLFKTIELGKIKYCEIDLKKHLKPIMTIFVGAISVNIYLQLDVFLIGSIAGDKYVGYYAVSNKLIRFVITFITIIGAVLLPRLTSMYQTDKVKYFEYLKKAFNFILIISLPFSILFLVFSKNIIRIIGGIEFEPSILTMQILSPLCTIVGIAYFLGYLVLYPQNKEKIYTQAVMFSALFSILINYFSIKTYYQNGAAVIAVFSELLAILLMFYLSKKDLQKLNLFDSNSLKIFLATIITFLVAILIKGSINNQGLGLFFVSIACVFLIFLGMLAFLKERTVSEIYSQLKTVSYKV